MNEQELLLDCVRRLNAQSVPYMLTGSMHKLYWNRITPSDRQLGDVAGVVQVQRGRLDESYLREWAAELKVSSRKATPTPWVPPTSLSVAGDHGRPLTISANTARRIGITRPSWASPSMDGSPTPEA